MALLPLLLIGAGGHARSCIDVIEADGCYEIAGLVGSKAEIGMQILGYPVLGDDGDLPRLIQEFRWAMVTVGQIKSPDVRQRLFETAIGCGAEFPVVISPRAQVSRHASLGRGCLVHHGAVINAGAQIGRNTIINSMALIEHDVVIGDHCHIATAAVINGDVTVGHGSFVGSTACVKQGLHIGERCVVGMGQTVLADCPDSTKLPSPEKRR